MFAVMAFTAQTSAQSADIPSIGFCGNTLYISNGTKNPKGLRFKALINNKANVLSDMLSLYSIPADCKSAGTLALLLHIQWYRLSVQSVCKTELTMDSVKML